MLLVKNTFPESYGNAANVSICVRAGLPKPRPVPDTERTKDTKTLDYASTPLDANTVLAVRCLLNVISFISIVNLLLSILI